VEKTASPSPKVLLVDDEEVFRTTLVKVLRARGIAAEGVASAGEAAEFLEHQNVDVVLLDLKMPGVGGIEALQHIAGKYPHLPVVIVTGHGTVEAGLQAVRELAFDFLLKPVPVDLLIRVVAAAAERGTQRR
jgi:DNA-binding NtrC family response regulator